VATEKTSTHLVTAADLNAAIVDVVASSASIAERRCSTVRTRGPPPKRRAELRPWLGVPHLCRQPSLAPSPACVGISAAARSRVEPPRQTSRPPPAFSAAAPSGRRGIVCMVSDKDFQILEVDDFNHRLPGEGIAGGGLEGSGGGGGHGEGGGAASRSGGRRNLQETRIFT
jgi:hypothetical protein